jgi:hypothetical protein
MLAPFAARERPRPGTDPEGGVIEEEDPGVHAAGPLLRERRQAPDEVGAVHVLAVLDIDPTGARPGQVAEELLAGRRSLIRVFRQNSKKALGMARIPGMASRWSVSWMARQSDSYTRTAEWRLPAIWIGS